MIRRLLPCSLVLVAPALLAAQSGGAHADTPAACVAAIQSFDQSGRGKMSADQFKAAQADSARACLARLSPPPATVPDSSLLDLARLYAAAGDTAALAATVTRYVSPPGASDTARAARMVAAGQVFAADHSPGHLAAAERLVARLDSMGPAFAAQQVAAHAPLLAYYRAVDVDDAIAAHASRVIALIPSLTLVQRVAASRTLTQAFVNLAQVYGGRAQADSALAILARGRSTLGKLPQAAAELDATSEQYALVGRPGAAIVGSRWLNAPPNTTRIDPAGQVTLVQFTAHWCGPCKKSYAAMARLQNAYAPRGLRTVFVTSLYGHFQGRADLTPEQEIAADSAYYLVEHKLPVQIAFSPSGTGGNAANYKVSGIPYIVVLDRAGKIRMIVIGWDPASEARIGKMIETALAEPR